MVGAAIANPMKRDDDSCLAAVTGKAALGDDSIRKEHCASFIKTIVTPAAITVTTTITDAPEYTEKPHPKRDVTVCPNEVPNYASACDEGHYKSACAVWGVTGETTITIPATTTTKTVYAGNGHGGADCGKTVTVTAADNTVTVTAAEKTITVTSTGGFGGPTITGHGDAAPVNGKCLTDDQAKEFVDAFQNLLENTNYTGAPSNGYNDSISKKYLDENFVDYSDSINWMAGIPVSLILSFIPPQD